MHLDQERRDWESILMNVIDLSETSQWIIQENVFLDESWESFFSFFDEVSAGLVAAKVCKIHSLNVLKDYEDFRDWCEIKYGSGDLYNCTLSIVRIQKDAALSVVDALKHNPNVPLEVLIPTTVAACGKVLFDINGQDKNWYSDQSLKDFGRSTYLKGGLHTPVEERIPMWRGIPNLMRTPKILFAVPISDDKSPLVQKMVASFSESSDLMFIKYTEGDAEGLEKLGTVVYDKGHKWQLAKRHLPPNLVDSYDFVFYWDDDIEISYFDPARFCRIMWSNRLSMCQPALTPLFPLSHQITARQPVPPRRGTHRIVGRLTNFVEIMVPTFTSEAWKEFYNQLDDNNQSGWGYDYIPLGNKGIVDEMPVIHTRCVQSYSQRSREELNDFMFNQGYVNYGHVTMGWLLEEK